MTFTDKKGEKAIKQYFVWDGKELQKATDHAAHLGLKNKAKEAALQAAADKAKQ